MDKRIVIAGMVGIGAYLLSRVAQNAVSDYPDEGVLDVVQTTIDQAIGANAAVEGYSTSPAMLDMLKKKENLVLHRYQLNDGGYTWGYGHYSKDPNALPYQITQEQADAIFADDVVNRAEKWVKLYVTVPLTQNQFDALVSIAYNMSPKSFKKFADSVNAGQGIDAIAQESVAWVAPEYTNGIQNRRNGEVAVFNNGVYA